MLYVFHVDTGTMMTFDMSLALESVGQLKQYVEKGCNIPCDKQVLLVSGGESLDDRSKVCSYSAGTDTNPIFLFSKSVIESTTPPSASVDYGSDYDFKSKVREAQDLPATYETVVLRAQLAKQFHDCAKQQTKICERLVLDQHLQQQGWAAVIANLEDLTEEFRRRASVFEQSFNDYLNEHDNYLTFLQHFNDDLQILAKIPIVPTLLDYDLSENITVETEASEETLRGDEGEVDDCENKKPLTLLQWISATDSRSTMDQLFEHCSKGLEQFDEKIFKSLHADIEKAVETSNQSNMKEVKGLGDRLFGLEQLMLEAKRYVREQADLAQSFQQNQNRAGNLGDTSILPDLCDSHRKQLVVMLHNHDQLCDIRRRCTRAKEELSVNLYHRLRWVMYVENLMLDANHKLVIYHDNLKRLRQHLEVLQQIHVAPATYLSAVAEVVRRRAFSQAFLLWASELACHLLTLHNEEVTRRKEFQSYFEGHFLNALFPGMDDLPPNFATQAPSIFDSSLPKITNEDIENLKKTLPDLTENFVVPDTSSITNFFLVKSLVKTELDKVDDRGIEEKIVEVVNEVGLASDLDQNLLKPTESETCLTPHGLAQLKDLDRGCESETDTEEFEKVCQSPLELHFEKDLPSPRPGSQDATTLTEVGDKSPLLPPKKPPRTFQKLTAPSTNENLTILQPQRALSISGSNTESFTNIKNTSLESIDELSSLKNADSCYNSHHQQLQGFNSGHFMRSKSLSPRTPQSPKGDPIMSPNSPLQGHQPSDFVNEEFYIDESLPSSLSIETGNAAQGDYAKQLSNANDVVALLQDNLQTSRTEHDRLKSVITKMAHLSRQAIAQIRNELSDLKSLYVSQKSSIEIHYGSLSNSWENLALEMDKEKEIIQRMTIDHELELSDCKKTIHVNNEELKFLRDENTRLETKLKELNETNEILQSELKSNYSTFEAKIAELNDKLEAFAIEKEKSIKEVQDRLSREHKAEVDSMRTRFRLMAGLERSPSDPNLEKIEKSEINHEAMLLQLKENFEIEKRRTIEDTKRSEMEKWETILAEKLEDMRTRFNTEKDELIKEVSKRITEDKDKKIEVLREKQAALNLECIKYKNTIQQLTEYELERDFLEKEKHYLEEKLGMERSKRFEQQDMTASVAICEGTKVDVATSPIKSKEKLTKSQSSIVRSARLNIESCSVGDAVLIIWDAVYENYTILQESNYLYFLHTDCLDTLGLKKPTGDEKKMFYYLGEVLEKEYCHAKKGENRYKVPKGTKFYRVKVKPLSQMREMSRSQLVASEPMTQSQTTSGQTFEQVATDSACHSMPNSPTTKGQYMDKALKVTNSKESDNENR